VLTTTSSRCRFVTAIHRADIENWFNVSVCETLFERRNSVFFVTSSIIIIWFPPPLCSIDLSGIRGTRSLIIHLLFSYFIVLLFYA